MNHYSVVSPELYNDELIDLVNGPPDPCRCYCEVDAKTPRKAKAAALRHHDMRDWTSECATTGANPFSGLKVQLLGNSLDFDDSP